jgi:hypothetical protein
VELPFTIVFEPPSRSELRALLRMRGYWVAGCIIALTIGSVYLLANVARADAGATAESVPLELSSQPAGAAVELDGHQRGATPLELTVEPGVHRVSLKANEAQEGQYTLEVGPAGAALDAVLWRQKPRLTRLRPALPGAVLTDVRLLEDGELGLSIGLPPGRQLQAWRLDPRSGALESVLTSVAGLRLTFAADGNHLAYLGSEIGPPLPGSEVFGSVDSASTVVWLVDPADTAVPTSGWRVPLEAREQPVDVSWSPRGDRLLVVTSQGLSGGAVRSRLWLVDSDGKHAQAVLNLPSEIVLGSELWSPDGQGVVFVAHAAELNALCLLRMDGTFRYVADLDPSASAPLQYPPLAWSADGQRLLFVAPHQHPPGAPIAWLQPDPKHAVYLASVDEPTAQLLADTDVDLATWREDGQLLGLGRAAPDGELSIRLLHGAAGADQQLLALPLKPSSRYAAAWDVSRARVLVAAQNTSGSVDYWLAQLGLEADR